MNGDRATLNKGTKGSSKTNTTRNSSSSGVGSSRNGRGGSSGSNGKSSTTRPTAKKATILDPPTFQLPPNIESSNSENGRYELWTIRLPISVDLNDLHGCRLTLPTADNPTTKPKPLNGSSSTDNDATASDSNRFASDGTDYTFQWGHAVENESFRVLVPKRSARGQPKEDDDTEDEDDDDNDSGEKDDGKWMVPCSLPFTRHLNVVQDVCSTLTEAHLAPGLNQGPVTSKALMRKAYAPVPQKTGLKRRWMPLGGDASFNADSLEASARTTATAAAAGASTKKRKQGGAPKREDVVPVRSSSSGRVEGSPSSKRMKAEHSPDDVDQVSSLPTPTRHKQEPPSQSTATPASTVKTEDVDIATTENHGKESERERKERKAAKKEKKAAKKAKKEQKADKRIKKEET